MAYNTRPQSIDLQEYAKQKACPIRRPVPRTLTHMHAHAQAHARTSTRAHKLTHARLHARARARAPRPCARCAESPFEARQAHVAPADGEPIWTAMTLSLVEDRTSRPSALEDWQTQLQKTVSDWQTQLHMLCHTL
eukprot:3339461-Pleurochrysis_carterae.AAC.1